MRAYIINSFGDSDVFVEKNIPTPPVASHQVLIEVHATSVNPVDTKIRSGAVPAIAPSFPAVLHGDVAGVVVETGVNVRHLQVGDKVYACAGGVQNTHGGALSEYLLADAQLVTQKPENLSFEESAALPLVAITAWEGLVDRAHLHAGQKILIHGGTGGVGHVAVQIAKTTGATVYTTCSTATKAQIARSLGADQVILYPEQSVGEYVDQFTDGAGFDVVMDTVGGKNIDRSFEAVRPHGQVVSISNRSKHDLTPMHSKGITLHAVFMLLDILHNQGDKHRIILEQIKHHVEQGAIKPLIDQILPVSQVAKAHQLQESGTICGKLILTWK